MRTSLRRTILLLGALAGCSDALTIQSSGDQLGGDPITVRTRPICGDGVVGPGEACDDGNADDDDGCDRQCQFPCEGGAVPIIGCGPGRTFEQRFSVYSMTQARWIDVERTIETVICPDKDGGEHELGVCTDGACIELLPPNDRTTCAATCGEGAACGAGETCVSVWTTGEATEDASIRVPAGLQTRTSRCMPAAGGGLWSVCEGGCGVGLGCNGVGAREHTWCLPADCETNADCPDRAICLPSINAITGDPTGRGCFEAEALPPGTGVPLNAGHRCLPGVARLAEQTQADCRRLCEVLDDCGRCFTNDAGDCSASLCRDLCAQNATARVLSCLDTRGCGAAERCSDVETPGSAAGYCTARCNSNRDCPDGWACAPYGDTLACLAPTAAFTPAPEYGLLPVRLFPNPGCPGDVDATCTFDSDCDPDCAASTGCGDVPPAGRCEGAQLRFCEANRVVSLDCRASGLRCGYDAGQRRFDCIGGG